MTRSDRRRTTRAAALGLLAAAAAAAGCVDFGDPVAPAPSGPTIDALVPARTFAGDTLVVEGTGLGGAPGTVLFGDVAAPILSWSDRSVRALVPNGAVAGPLRLRIDGTDTNALDFETAAPVSFAADVEPLFFAYDCVSCHAFGTISGGFEVLPHARLVAGTAVVPRRSGSSELRRRLLSTTPFAQRMPEGGPFLTDAEILVIADWIDQGARDD